MALRDIALADFEHEMMQTRKALERVPDELWGWKPHPKSFSFGDLANHIVNMVHWIPTTLQSEGLDLDPNFKLPTLPNRAELLAEFDKNLSAAQSALTAAVDSALTTNWTLSAGGKPLFTMPRVAVLRSMIVNHLVHHRGQLTVYLRINNVPLPDLYGPTADSPQG
jgi:uncharacterized damage-inducible protein DinB